MVLSIKKIFCRFRICIAIFSLFFIQNYSYGEVVETPYDMFSLENSQAKTAVITIKVVKNIEETCRKLGSKKSNEPTTKYVEACSTWSLLGGKVICTIFTPKHIDYWILGHEVRHCFQGRFHE
jgi:hypothetical protein